LGNRGIPGGRGAAVALVLGAIVSIQTGTAAATTLFDEVGPAGTVFLRLSLAALILLAIWRPRVSGLSREQRRLAALFGLSLAGMNILFYESLDRIPLGIAVTLEFVGPLAVAIWGTRRPLDLLWVGLATAGILLLTGPGGSSPDALGVALALGAGACWGGYILITARVGRVYEGGSGLALAMAVGALLMTVPGVASGGAGLLGPEVLGVAAVVALMCSVVPYSLELESLRRIPTQVFGVMMSLEPGVAAAVGLIALGQGLALAEVGGIALVVIASAGALREAGGQTPPPTEV
jgi:inner membrane transporter RhtA